MNIDLSNYARKLTQAISLRDERALEQICFDLEYSQLEHEKWSEQLFNFFIGAIQDESLCKMQKSSGLISSIYNDFEKLTANQQHSLLNIIDGNADQFANEILRHSISDLIARKYPSDIAIRLFEKWKDEASKNRSHMALVGFDVLLLSRTLNQSIEPRIRQYVKQLSGDE